MKRVLLASALSILGAKLNAEPFATIKGSGGSFTSHTKHYLAHYFDDTTIAYFDYLMSEGWTITIGLPSLYDDPAEKGHCEVTIERERTGSGNVKAPVGGARGEGSTKEKINVKGPCDAVERLVREAKK